MASRGALEDTIRLDAQNPPTITPKDVKTHLMGYVWPRICDVPARLCQDALVVVAVEESILDVPLAPILAPPRGAHPIRLETRLLQNDIQPPLRGCRAALGDVGLDREHERVRLLLERVVRLLLLHFSCFQRRRKRLRGTLVWCGVAVVAFGVGKDRGGGGSWLSSGRGGRAVPVVDLHGICVRLRVTGLRLLLAARLVARARGLGCPLLAGSPLVWGRGLGPCWDLGEGGAGLLDWREHGAGNISRVPAAAGGGSSERHGAWQQERRAGR